ncbi:hypothetical protein [Amedibacillus dolichus]|uniref:hypothetical protein n=1 Tax=Amedibacillus dolichus TaxID=31971 RepID=UPI0029430639|nr:hypothetical protein [Amedibacillus dolichus]
MEEWISLTEYMKRFHLGYKEVKKMIDNNELEYKQSEGGRFRIKVGGNTVSRELYESEKEKRIQAETKLELLKRVLIGGK